MKEVKFKKVKSGGERASGFFFAKDKKTKKLVKAQENEMLRRFKKAEFKIALWNRKSKGETVCDGVYSVSNSDIHELLGLWGTLKHYEETLFEDIVNAASERIKHLHKENEKLGKAFLKVLKKNEKGGKKK